MSADRLHERNLPAAFWAVVPAVIGFLLGMGFLLLIDVLTPHLHIGNWICSVSPNL